MLGTKMLVWIGIPLVIIIVWKYIDFSLTISSLESENDNQKTEILVLKTDINTERDNVVRLKTVVKELNTEIEKLSVKYQNTYKAFEAYKAKKESEKYDGYVLDLIQSNKWNSMLCEDGIMLNKMISELKYEDL